MRRTWIALLIALMSLAQVRAAEPPKRTELDDAVDRALEFLSLTQDPDGAWRAGSNKSTAVTGFCVMAFLSAGHVPGEGRYGATVEKGVRWVMQAQHPNGLIARGDGHEMYHHGICTLMLAEVVGMTDSRLGEEVRQKLEKAVAVILKAQRTTGVHRGGWRYTIHGSDADITVTGWQLLALRAAKNLGCDIPPECIDRAIDYVKRCKDPSSGSFAYTAGSGGTTTPRTGTGILSLELCGKELHLSPEAQKAGSYLLRNPPRWGQENYFFYSVYYCSQAMFQLGGNFWNSYRPLLHDSLLKHQNKNGSWTSPRGSEASYGPNYCSSLAVLSLTVEYRFLPIYQRGEEPTKD